MAIQFTKMSGSGNDFIIIDNRVPVMEDDKKRDFVRRVCDRRMSIGADGVIFVENSDCADVKWDFYNAWPSNVSAIDLNWDSVNTIQEFTIDWQYDYYLHGQAKIDNTA